MPGRLPDVFAGAPVRVLGRYEGSPEGAIMLQAAGLGIAFHAKPKVAASAAARLDHADLTGLLFVQGFGHEEFVARA
ncbi:MAG: hypothetical protein HC829_01110 [Bacteroidales bacterium]|nr:hypothetical protein [Bacteroidales bacterium]